MYGFYEGPFWEWSRACERLYWYTNSNSLTGLRVRSDYGMDLISLDAPFLGRVT